MDVQLHFSFHKIEVVLQHFLNDIKHHQCLQQFLLLILHLIVDFVFFVLIVRNVQYYDQYQVTVQCYRFCKILKKIDEIQAFQFKSKTRHLHDN